MNLSVGDAVDEVEFDVERGKIREFARASFTEDTVHTGPGSDALATLTHTAVTAHLRDQRGFVAALGLDIHRIVVGSCSWSYRRPLAAGDRLTATRRVLSDETREGASGTMRLVTLETEFTDQDGEVPVTFREVLIERAS
ncbi:acyl dehydratase [Frondihabitans sp. PAMC 28766]|uniref:FAS1-like dehydratase domain-containing protein n=1 Tax=Frondihabitans sp. PAMC 28766 TaxID=1795630 RepID=UPI00078DE0B0|nr:MaoC family dehydratase N-terminal domain-containing protein [Frondihabitans sp. PAMC 28766]AMM21860.1 acyl dehydratase [Frondihabitans sp. PAMC 28766]